MIEAEILGRVLPHFIYKFTDKTGNEIKGLSLNGVRETVRRLNRNQGSGHKIRISPERPIINRDVEQNNQKGIEVMVYAEDLQSGGGAWGSKFEPYVKVGKGGRTYENKFALETGLSKAQRNAQRALIPEKIVTEMIDKLAKGKDAVKQIEAPKKSEVVVETEATNGQKLYALTLKRIQAISNDKVKLNQALKNIGKLSLDKEKKDLIKSQIEQCLEAL
jgi:hypothetical protein